MKRRKFNPEQITEILQHAEFGIEAKVICCKHRISEQTFYRWKKKYICGPKTILYKHNIDNLKLNWLTFGQHLKS